MKMRVLAVVAQRNETVLIEPWVRYHAYMFGLENIHIIDNASDSTDVLAKIDGFETMGVGVTRIPPGATLAERGAYIVEAITRLEREHDYDVIFPLDADEFVCFYDEAGQPSCNRSDLLTYLSELARDPGKYEILEGVENLNKVSGVYVSRRHYKKVFFTSRQIKSLTIGSHDGEAINQTGLRPTRIFYLHFQVKPHALFLPLARQKLEDYVDVNDKEALLSYVGANQHVAPYLAMTEAEYDEALDEIRRNDPAVEREFPDFRQLLTFLQQNPNIF